MIKTNFAVLMAERGLKIADVYEETGISKTTLMALAENTGKGVQFETVDKLCNFLGVELKDFFVYVPYIWDFIPKEDAEKAFNKDDIGDDAVSNALVFETICTHQVVVKLRGKNSVKDYTISFMVYDPRCDFFPLDDKDIKLWLEINLKDLGDDEDFWEFLHSLPIPMKTHFNNQLFQTIKDMLLQGDNQVAAFLDSDILTPSTQLQEIPLEKNDKIYISLFPDSNDKQMTETKIIKI